MSDLQCPAMVILLTPESAAISDLPDQRLALVLFAADSQAAATAAARVAGAHGCEVRAADITDSKQLTAKISELSDMYRGEQVAIIASDNTAFTALNLDSPVKLAVDSDGWRILSR